MPIIWFKQSSDKKELICDGVVHVYDFIGNLVTDNGTFNASHLSGAVRVNMISLLKSGVSEMEIGVFQAESFLRCNTKRTFEDILGNLISAKGYLGYLQKAGKQDDVSYTQVLLVYPETKDVALLLRDSKLITEVIT